MDVTWLKTRTTNIEGWSHVYLKVRFEEMTKQQKIFHKFFLFEFERDTSSSEA